MCLFITSYTSTFSISASRLRSPRQIPGLPPRPKFSFLGCDPLYQSITIHILHQTNLTEVINLQVPPFHTHPFRSDFAVTIWDEIHEPKGLSIGLDRPWNMVFGVTGCSNSHHSATGPHEFCYWSERWCARSLNWPDVDYRRRSTTEAPTCAWSNHGDEQLDVY